MNRILSSAFLSTLLFSGLAHAACTGSGTTWSCSSGTTSAEVSTALSGASDGATLTFSAGSYAWSSNINFSMNKAATLRCATKGACTVGGSGTVGMNGTCSGNSDKVYRVSGFVFNGSNDPRFWWYGPNACTLNNVRIDNNTFTGTVNDAVIMYFGENSSTDNYFHGVVDHNMFSCSGSCMSALLLNGTSNNRPIHGPGTWQNLFFEDNTLTVTTQANTGHGAIDGWGGHGVVWRFNSVTNSRVLMHGLQHNFGPRNFEVYRNSITQNAGSLLKDGYRSIHHQGSGTFMVFDNTIIPYSSISGSAIEFLHYRSWTSGSGLGICDGTVSADGNRAPTTTYRGYPCKNQPSRDWRGNLWPIYSWSNRTGGGEKIDLNCDGQGGSATCNDHVRANRDRYEAVSAVPQSSSSFPFDGTVGVGFGTLANRPTTCTTNSLEAGGGVGYFATDQGPLGTLYRCSAQNTWTVHYTPYAYPHPLVSGTAAAPLPVPEGLVAR